MIEAHEPIFSLDLIEWMSYSDDGRRKVECQGLELAMLYGTQGLNCQLNDNLKQGDEAAVQEW